MPAYSKKQLTEQREMIGVIRSLTALTAFRLQKTEETMKKTNEILKRVDESIKRVFEITPKGSVDEAEGRVRKGVPIVRKPLLIFSSSNEDLYGDLIPEIAKLFVADMRLGGNDGAVIGSVGKSLIEDEKLTNNITYFELDDDQPDLAVFEKILALVNEYSKIVIYYGVAESFLKQAATKSEIEEELIEFAKPAKTYFFEPTPEEVFRFLQKQSVINHFHQKMFEAQMARLGARRWNWTKQQMARTRLLEELVRGYKRYKRIVMQSQQLVTLSAQRISHEEV